MLSKKQIIKNLRKIKITENFIIIHSDITGLFFKNFSIEELWKMIFLSLGKDKTYIMPTFNLTNKKKIWKSLSSKSETGILSEYFRKKIALKRTIHPLHSVSIFGKNINKIKIKNSASSFGKGSIWEWICTSKDVCNLSFGLRLNGGATFCHYSEEIMRVNYREYIDLKIKVFNNKNKLQKKKFSYFGRKKNIFNDWNRCEKDLYQNQLIKKYVFSENKYIITKMNTQKVTNFIINKLKKDNNYLIKKFT